VLRSVTCCSLVDAQVDLNPHQVEAELFAFHRHLSKGVILADEVGSGKTIEAGLVTVQRWRTPAQCCEAGWLLRRH
ncbi:MAG: hypothetical protein U5M53_02500, partial [Rhodoferax sp.]|nr:hypothetical protein [Rhodoferax sp.]